MKYIQSIRGRVALAVLAALALCGAIALHFSASPALAQVTPKNVTTLTLSASTMASGSTGTVTSQAFSINPATGFAIIPTFACTATGTGNLTYSFAASTDGTTWTTTTPWTAAFAATGTTPVIGFYNFPATAGSGTGASNIGYIRLQSVTNATGTIATLTSLKVSRSN